MSFELVSEVDGFESRRGSDGVTVEVCEVREVVMRKSITAYESPNEAFTTKGVLTFLYNGALQIKSLSNPKKFLCMSDGVVRNEIPGAGSNREQRWVYYGPYEVTTAFDGA